MRVPMSLRELGQLAGMTDDPNIAKPTTARPKAGSGSHGRPIMGERLFRDCMEY